MNKILIAIALAACGGASRAQPTGSDAPPATTAKARVRIVQVARTDTLAERTDKFAEHRWTTVTFDFYIDRLDLGLSQRDGRGYESELPPALRSRYLYLSEPDDLAPDSGSFCDRGVFPYRCEPHRLSPSPQPGPHDFLAKITFEDGAYAAVPITVTIPAALPIPQMVEPKTAPAQGSKLALAFRDLEAESWLVEVAMCKPHRNDGNPCVDEHSYKLVRQDGTLVAKDATVSTADGVVRLTSPLALAFEERLILDIEATRVENAGGVEVRRAAHVRRELQR